MVQSSHWNRCACGWCVSTLVVGRWHKLSWISRGFRLLQQCSSGYRNIASLANQTRLLDTWAIGPWRWECYVAPKRRDPVIHNRSVLFQINGIFILKNFAGISSVITVDIVYIVFIKLGSFHYFEKTFTAKTVSLNTVKRPVLIGSNLSNDTTLDIFTF
jgi:hypothetical protein